MGGGGTASKRILLGALASAALLVAPAQAGAVSFFRGDFPVGTQPTSVAVGNFNGGASDLAVANEGTDNASILLGNGFGQFTAGIPVSVGDAPSSIVTGLFNNDAFTDLAVASIGNDNIAIRLGDGQGGFTGTGTVSTGTSSDPRAIAAGDFDNDGKTDLVSANNGNSTVSIMPGDGLGSFTPDPSPENVSTVAANPVSIAVGRFEAPDPPGTPDPDLDAIITSQTSDQVLALTGDGTGGFAGTFGQYTTMFSMTNPDPSAVAVGSLNPGSLNPAFAAEPDILVADQVPDNVLPGFGNVPSASFGFGTALPTGADPVAVAFGDLDGDGDQDGITANSGGATATVLLSDGTGGTSTDTSPPVGLSPRAVATGAFDADARADVAVANYDSNSVTVLSSLTPGPPFTAPPTTSPPTVQPKKRCKKKKHRAAEAKKKCKKKRR